MLIKYLVILKDGTIKPVMLEEIPEKMTITVMGKDKTVYDHYIRVPGGHFEFSHTTEDPTSS